MLERSRNGAKVRRSLAGSAGSARRKTARRAAAANLVAVESLKPGDEILTPWGRDRIDVLSQSYNIAITERKRQIPIRRAGGRPNLVKKADPAAASRTVSAARPAGRPMVVHFARDSFNLASKAKRVLLYHYNVESTIDDVGSLTIYLPNDPKVVKQVNELLDDYDALAGKKTAPLSRKKPAAEANLRLFTLLAAARLVPILRKLGMSPAKANQLTALLQKARTASEAYDKLVQELGSRADFVAKQVGLETEGSGPKVPPGYKRTTVDQLIPGDEIIVYPHGKDVVERVSNNRRAVKTRDGQILAGKAVVYVRASRRAASAAGREDFVPSVIQATFNSRANAGNAIADLRDIGVQARMQSSFFRDRRTMRGPNKGVTTITVSMPLDPKQAKQIYRIFDDWDGQPATTYTASRQTASAALPALLAVARVAPILLRFGLTAARAQAIATALQRASTVAEAMAILTKALGGTAQTVAKALGIHEEQKMASTARAARRMKVSSINELARLAQSDPAYEKLAKEAARNLGGGPRETSSLDAAIRWLNMNADETSERGVVKEINFVARDLPLSRRSARAGWKGAPEEQQPLRQKFGTLARMLMQHNVSDPKKLPDDAKKSFNALLAAVVEKSDVPVKDIVGQAMKQAKSYIEQQATSASKSASASRRAVFGFPSEKKANAFAAEIDGQRGVISYVHSPGSLKVTVKSMDDWFGDYYARKYGGEQVEGASKKPAQASVDPTLERLVLRALNSSPMDKETLAEWEDAPEDAVDDLIGFVPYLEKYEDDERAMAQAVQVVKAWLAKKRSELGTSRDVRASTIDDMEAAVRLLVDYQVDKPHMLPPDAEREFWQIMAKVSSARRSSPGQEATRAYNGAKWQKQRAARASRLARVAVKAARRQLGIATSKQQRPAASAAYPGFKDSAKVATLKTFRVSLKVDAREGSYDSAKDLAQHIDDALQAAGLNAYDVYVR